MWLLWVARRPPHLGNPPPPSTAKPTPHTLQPTPPLDPPADPPPPQLPPPKFCFCGPVVLWAQNTFGPTEGQKEQWREANRRRQRQIIRYRGLVPNPSPSFDR